MSQCPACQQQLPALAIECPRCHTDLLPPTAEATQDGWEHSAIADLFLIVGSFILAIQSLITGLAVLGMLYYVPLGPGRLADRLLVALGWGTSFFLSVALLIVTQRVSNQSRS